MSTYKFFFNYLNLLGLYKTLSEIILEIFNHVVAYLIKVNELTTQVPFENSDFCER